MTTPTVRLENPTDLLDAIPPLLGFIPEESLVALIFQDTGRLGVTARIDLTDAFGAADHLCATLTQHGTSAILAAYTTRPDHGAPEIARFTALMHVTEAIATDGHRWWSLTCNHDCCASFPKVGPLMDQAKAEVLAFTGFPKSHWRKVWSTNPTP